MAGRSRASRLAAPASLAATLDRHPPPVLFERRLVLRRWLSVALLDLLSVVLLSVSFPPMDGWIFAYVALVPLVLATAGGVRGWSVLLFGWLAGLTFWAVNLYWLTWVTWPGYAGLVVFCSLYWLVGVALLRAAARRRWPMSVALPVVWVTLEYARAHVISGFPWFFLAHTQYRHTALIQICDLTGQYGVSFVVAMINGAWADALASPLFVPRADGSARLARRHLGALAASGVSVAGLLAYGSYRLGQEATTPGPVVGVVQEAFPIWLGKSPDAPDEGTRGKWHADEFRKFDAHYALTRAAFPHAGCDLVIWPETMVPSGLNADVLRLQPATMPADQARALAAQFAPSVAPTIDDVPESRVRRFLTQVIGGLEGRTPRDPPLTVLAGRLMQLSQRIGCPLLIGGGTQHPNPRATGRLDTWISRNSALWFDGASWSPGEPAWPQAEYAKLHLVPFSEFVPFKYSWPWAHRMLRTVVPAVMQQLESGPGPVRFTLRRGKATWRIAPVICYEGTFPRVCRQMVMDGPVKKADVLVNVSNDGWFVWKWGPWAGQGSAEQVQHMVQYCFRAVENRVPVVRAVNTGISASIDSCGRIVAEVRRGKVRTAMLTGTLLLGPGRGDPASAQLLSGEGFPQVFLDKRTTLYSKLGDWFAGALCLLTAGTTAWMLCTRLLHRRRAKDGRAKGR